MALVSRSDGVTATGAARAMKLDDACIGAGAICGVTLMNSRRSRGNTSKQRRGRQRMGLLHDERQRPGSSCPTDMRLQPRRDKTIGSTSSGQAAEDEFSRGAGPIITRKLRVIAV